MYHRRALSGVILATACAAALPLVPAAAQTRPATSAAPSASANAPPAGTVDARKIFRAAHDAFEQGKYDVAYKDFLEVWNALKSPRVAGNLGLTEVKLKKYRDGAEHLSLFLREQKDLAEEDRNEVAGPLKEAKAHVGVLRVEATPAGADVLVDGTSAGTAPLGHELYVDPGHHTVEVRFDGRSARKELDARAGVEEPLIKLDVPPPPKPLPTAAPTPLVVPSAAPEATRIPWHPIGIAAGGVVAIVGGVLIGVAPGRKREAEAFAPKDMNGNLICSKRGAMYDRTQNTDCEKLRGMTSAADTMWGAGIAMLIVGAAGAAAAGIHWYLSGSHAAPNKPSSRLVPVVGVNGGGLTLQGSF